MRALAERCMRCVCGCSFGDTNERVAWNTFDSVQQAWCQVQAMLYPPPRSAGTVRNGKVHVCRQQKLIPRLLDKRWDVWDYIGFNRGRLQTVWFMKQTYVFGIGSSCQVTRLERQTVQYARPRSEVLYIIIRNFRTSSPNHDLACAFNQVCLKAIWVSISEPRQFWT